MAVQLVCPSCDAHIGAPFYELPAVPINSCLLIDDQDAALTFPVAPLRLSLCSTCGFIFNAAWEPERTVYSERYEETQAFSETFNVFQERLVRDLIVRDHLQHKHIVEIGCGKGEFLTLLCQLGENTGLGFDPSFVSARQKPDAGRVQFVCRFFDETTGPLTCDFLCCKMTLEHIRNVGDFFDTIRRSLGDQENTQIFFQVPNASRILQEAAFWDIYYEHCSYFTHSSLSSLFERSGFKVDRVWTDYDEQYLMIEGRPAPEPIIDPTRLREVGVIADQIENFTAKVTTTIASWRDRLMASAACGKRIVLWGSGSKAVAFLTTLKLDREIVAVVDINPFRQGCFMPVSGHPIIAPREAASLKPDQVIIMNPVYRTEISRELDSYDCRPEILTV